MQHEGDLEGSRKAFEKRPNNLVFLLKHRFEWMNEYCEGRENIIELGAGAGFTRYFIRTPNLKLSDFTKHPWIDLEIDALNIGLDAASVDVIICSHMIHHLASPVKFFKEVARVLKPGGLLLIVDIETGFLMRLLLRIMRHEGWSFDVDVFDENAVCNDPSDVWSANCAIPKMLFQNPERFEKSLPDFEILKNERFEGFVFPLSGGVNAKTRTVQLPFPVLKAIRALDNLLIKIAPSFFAMGRKVVLRKK